VYGTVRYCIELFVQYCIDCTGMYDASLYRVILSELYWTVLYCVLCALEREGAAEPCPTRGTARRREKLCVGAPSPRASGAASGKTAGTRIDSSKVAVCTRFLRGLACDTAQCRLAHRARTRRACPTAPSSPKVQYSTVKYRLGLCCPRCSAVQYRPLLPKVHRLGAFVLPSVAPRARARLLL